MHYNDSKLVTSKKQDHGRIKISVSPFYFSVITAMCILDATGIVMVSLLSSLIHESAHIAVSYIMGSTNLSFEFKIPAMSIKRCSPLQLGYVQEAAISAAGPIINLLIAVLLNIIFGVNSASIINYALCLINSLPIYTLDGGNVIFCLLSLRLNPITAGKIIKAVSYTVIIPIIISGIAILIVTGKNFSLLAIGLFLIISLISGKN